MAHKCNMKTGYPFAGAFEGRKVTTEDHVLSGATELMTLLQGQETVTKQNVIQRIAELSAKGITPKVYTVRNLIVQEAQKVGYGLN